MFYPSDVFSEIENKENAAKGWNNFDSFLTSGFYPWLFVFVVICLNDPRMHCILSRCLLKI